VLAYKPISEIVAGGMSTVPGITLSILTARFPGVQIGRSGSAAPAPGGREFKSAACASQHVQGAFDQNHRVERSTWPSQTDVKCRHTVSGGASAYRFARFLNSSRL
jgi:hypothetical protein